MVEKIIDVGEGFWNIRGSYRAGGLVQIGTHASLVRLADGRFVLLDSYTLPGPILEQVRALTGGGKDIDAIINVHPFHTMHVVRAHEQFPQARLFGTTRHVQKAADLPWQALTVEDSAMHALFADDLDFSIPRGVDFISTRPTVHFSSVLVYHRASKTIHVDDTLNYVPLPVIGGVQFHPTLKAALQKGPEAAAAFESWADALIEQWGAARNLCAAHSGALIGAADLAGQLRRALGLVKVVLRTHR